MEMKNSKMENSKDILISRQSLEDHTVDISHIDHFDNMSIKSTLQDLSALKYLNSDSFGYVHYLNEFNKRHLEETLLFNIIPFISNICNKEIDHNYQYKSFIVEALKSEYNLDVHNEIKSNSSEFYIRFYFTSRSIVNDLFTVYSRISIALILDKKLPKIEFDIINFYNVYQYQGIEDIRRDIYSPKYLKGSFFSIEIMQEILSLQRYLCELKMTKT